MCLRPETLLEQDRAFVAEPGRVVNIALRGPPMRKYITMFGLPTIRTYIFALAPNPADPSGATTLQYQNRGFKAKNRKPMALIFFSYPIDHR
jgi:hypothetical protein